MGWQCLFSRALRARNSKCFSFNARKIFETWTTAKNSYYFAKTVNRSDFQKYVNK